MPDYFETVVTQVANAIALTAHSQPQTETTQAPPQEAPRPSPARMRDLRVGPIDIRIDMKPFNDGFEAFTRALGRISDNLLSPQVTSIVTELARGQREPQDTVEELIVRAVRGPTRFQRLLDHPEADDSE